MERIETKDSRQRERTNVIGAMNEVVFVLNAKIPQDEVQEPGAVMEVQAVSVAHMSAASKACQHVIRRRPHGPWQPVQSF